MEDIFEKIDAREPVLVSIKCFSPKCESGRETYSPLKLIFFKNSIYLVSIITYKMNPVAHPSLLGHIGRRFTLDFFNKNNENVDFLLI